MRRRIIAAAATSILAVGIVGGTGAVAHAENGTGGATPIVTGPSPVTTEFNGGTCAVEPFTTSVSFGEGASEDGRENNGWNGRFDEKTATLGAGIQNFKVGSSMAYRPWVGISAYEGRTISDVIVEFKVTAGIDEGADWAFRTLPDDNGVPATSFAEEPIVKDPATGSFRVEIPVKDDSRAYGHRAGWVVTSAAGGSDTSHARGASITVSGGQLSSLPGENSDCQPLFWDGTVQPIFGNGTPGMNGLVVNANESDVQRISGTVTDVAGNVVEGAAVSLTADGAVSVSVPEREDDYVIVQLMDGEVAIGEPFAQALLSTTHESTPTVNADVKAGETATLPAPRDANDQEYPEGTTFAAIGSPQLIDEDLSNSMTALAAASESWATVAADGTITITPGADVAGGTYALGVRATLPNGQSDDVNVYFSVLAAESTEEPDDAGTDGVGTEGEGSVDVASASEAGTVTDSAKSDPLANTGADSTLVFAVIAALVAIAGGGLMLRRRM